MKRFIFIFIFAILFCCRANFGVTLDQLLQKTVDKNPEIERAKCELERASGQRLVLRSVALPDAVIGVAVGDQGGHRAGEDSNQPFGFGYGGFTQPFFNAAIPASFRRGDLEVLIAEQKLYVAMMNQLHNARATFYTALYNRGLNHIRTEQRQRLEQNTGSQKDRYESGLADRAMYVGAEIQTRELDPQVEASQRSYDGAILKLAEAMGENLGPSALLPEPAGELKYVRININRDAEIRNALERRPDLKLARLLVRAANEEQRIMEAAYYPLVNAVVAGEYIPVTGVRRFQAQGSPRRSDDIISSEVRLGGAYTWRIMDSGKTYGAVLKQRSAREINEILVQKLERETVREMSRIQHDLQAISTKYDELAKASVAAEENAASVQQNLSGGVISQLDYRLAQNDSLDVKSQLLTLAYQENMARAEWDRVTGRYFQFSDGKRKNVQ